MSAHKGVDDDAYAAALAFLDSTLKALCIEDEPVKVSQQHSSLTLKHSRYRGYVDDDGIATQDITSSYPTGISYDDDDEVETNGTEVVMSEPHRSTLDLHEEWRSAQAVGVRRDLQEARFPAKWDHDDEAMQEVHYPTLLSYNDEPVSSEEPPKEQRTTSSDLTLLNYDDEPTLDDQNRVTKPRKPDAIAQRSKKPRHIPSTIPSHLPYDDSPATDADDESTETEDNHHRSHTSTHGPPPLRTHHDYIDRDTPFLNNSDFDAQMQAKLEVERNVDWKTRAANDRARIQATIDEQRRRHQEAAGYFQRRESIWNGGDEPRVEMRERQRETYKREVCDIEREVHGMSWEYEKEGAKLWRMD